MKQTVFVLTEGIRNEREWHCVFVRPVWVSCHRREVFLYFFVWWLA
jgi:hypothetical protein